MEKIGVKQATKDEIIPMQIPGVCDLSYPTSKFRRGRVQGGGYNLHSEIPHSNRQAVSIEKNPKIAGNFSGHQWGVTSCRYGVLPTIVASNYKYPPLVIKVCGNK